eukprot:767617-Hanusia_phi.AAC.8
MEVEEDRDEGRRMGKGGESKGRGGFVQQLVKRTQAGCFALSTFLSERSVVPGMIEAHKAAGRRIMPMLQWHGEDDDMISCKWGEDSVKKMQAAGAEIDWKTFVGLQHSLRSDEVKELVAWINGRLNA